jgi:MFS family permease
VTYRLAILNLFVTGYWFKKIGLKTAMFQQTFWAALRSLTQIYALSVGGSFGIWMITITQTFNILGSGGGYELASMAYIAELCGQEERTGMFGVLLGIRMLGAAVGYICESTHTVGYPSFGLRKPGERQR